MNQKEWKLHYSAFRRLYGGLFSQGIPMGVNYINDESFKLAVKSVYRFADSYHWSIQEVWLNRPISYGRRDFYLIVKGIKGYQIKINTYS